MFQLLELASRGAYRASLPRKLDMAAQQHERADCAAVLKMPPHGKAQPLAVVCQGYQLETLAGTVGVAERVELRYLCTR